MKLSTIRLRLTRSPDTETPLAPMYAKLTIPLLLAALISCSAEHDAVNHEQDSDAGQSATSQPTSKPSAQASGTKLSSDKFAQYGAGVHEGAATPVAEVLANPAKFSASTIRVEGPIVSVCTKKGCWVQVGTGASNMRVKFKDYGFFLPTDATGHIVLEGQASVKTITVAQLRHYLEDAGKHDEAMKITEPRTEVSFLATGAAIKKAE